MVGLIWFVQIVHYPLFDRVGGTGFAVYEKTHQRLTTWVVGPLMLLELATAAGLLVSALRSQSASLPWAAAGALLLAGIWATTFLLSVPQHQKLAQGFDARAHARLVTTNWLRTLGWTARGGIALWLAAGF